MRRNQLQMRVNWGDTDKAGIVYYPNYFKWFDIAGHQFFRSIGYHPGVLADEQQIVLPMVDVRCTFEKPLYYDDIITVKTEVEQINRKTIKLKHEVFRGETRTGYGYEIRGWVKDTNGTLKAELIPDELRAILETDEEVDFTQNNPWLNA